MNKLNFVGAAIFLFALVGVVQSKNLRRQGPSQEKPIDAGTEYPATDLDGDGSFDEEEFVDALISGLFGSIAEDDDDDDDDDGNYYYEEPMAFHVSGSLGEIDLLITPIYEDDLDEDEWELEFDPEWEPEWEPEWKSEWGEEPDWEPEWEPESKPELERESKPEVEPESKPELGPESKPELEPKPKPKLESDSKPELGPKPKPDLESESKPEVEPESKPELGDDDEPLKKRRQPLGVKRGKHENVPQMKRQQHRQAKMYERELRNKRRHPKYE